MAGPAQLVEGTVAGNSIGRRTPVVALVMGDPAGISPELTAKLLALDQVQAAALVVVGDRRVLEDGARVAGGALDVEIISADAPLPESHTRPVLIDLGHLDPTTIRRSEVSLAGGLFAKDNFLSALALAKTGARSGQFDAVLTMFHDQGQIAMKLIGFDQGVTLLGGFPVPITTPAHGTAYDIAGKGIANIGASRNAVMLAARMGREAANAGSRPRISLADARAALALGAAPQAA
jgi:4-hydroxy-L-threonine phosphate dehydrogenase PdxA